MLPIFLFRKELDKLVKEDLIEIDEDKIRLTNKGLDLANLVWEEFVSNNLGYVLTHNYFLQNLIFHNVYIHFFLDI